ncbi:MAG: preprotein translocase subunit TatC [Paenibacillaceae bacterium]|jgi:sec-independent protein translocase protein TatC|nr:preprotein translocase subunit TatC [Paenibacillaceae bacterium]
MEDGDMGLMEHISELRKRVIAVLAVLVITMTGGLFLASYVIKYLKNTAPAKDLTWNAISLWDGINVYMQFAFVLALVVTLPFTMYQLWAFVKPGLKTNEQKAALRFVPLSALLFLAGLAFSYGVVFKMAVYFTSKVNRGLGLTEIYGVRQYFSFMFNIILPVSLLFELPVLIMFLTQLKLVNPARLKKLRRYAYLALVVVATAITPPDFISDLLVAVPLIALYEFSIMLSARVYRKQLAKEKQWEEEFYGKKNGGETA